MSLALRVATRYLQSAYFKPGDIVLYGKYKNKRAKIVGFGSDKWGNPTIEVEPIPKGRKQNKIFGLFRIWRADVKEKALAEKALAEKELAEKTVVMASEPDELLYAAVMLDEASQQKLLKWWESEVGPLLSTKMAEHMTIQVKPSRGEAQALPLGRKARIRVVGYAQDDDAQAVAVKGMGSQKSIPHVTVAVSSGGQPRHSDVVLGQRLKSARGPTLTGEIGVVTRRRVIFDPKRLM